jgi:4-amino-4-deoxy-L-arabinose transferase-like glycosyltransferase
LIKARKNNLFNSRALVKHETCFVRQSALARRRCFARQSFSGGGCDSYRIFAAYLTVFPIKSAFNLKIPFWVFLLIAAVYFCSVRVDVMDVDASQYAEISREMAHTGSYLQLYDRGLDYLDKPPFLFWMSSLSMEVFGPNNFSYRLPSILFALLALYSVYRLTKLLYDESTGRLAALVLGCCQGLFLWTNDIRTDTILMSCVITGIWLLMEWELDRRWYHLLGGTAAVACGMMTKGPIALFVPAFALGTDWLLKREFKKIFSPWHIVEFLLIGIFLIPMSIGLYQQYDLHPEKIIDGQMHVSGLKFFFWTQSFGRITGENTWENGADPFFLLNSMTWAFLPWILIFLAAMVRNFWMLIKQKFRLFPGQEWISTGGFLLSYLSLCLSKYQLPHYIFVAFPLAAIVVAVILRDILWESKMLGWKKAFTYIHTVVSALLLVAALGVITFIFPTGIFGLILWAIAVVVWLYLAFKKSIQPKVIWLPVAAMILANFFVINYFYYPLMRYQCGSVVGKFIYEKGISTDHVYSWKAGDPLACIDFYARGIVQNSEEPKHPGATGDYLLTLKKNLSTLDSAGEKYQIVLEGERFKVSELTPEFINAKTRSKAVDPYCLLQLR